MTLTKKDHPVAKKIRLVVSQARRAPKDLVVAEGIRVLEEATASGHKIDVIVVSETFGQEKRERALLSIWESRKNRVCRASESLLKSLSGVQTPQGALALVRVPVRVFEDLSPMDPTLILCACDIQDPGNLGTLLRSAVAAGVSLVCTTPTTVSARNSKCIRSSAGAFFRIPTVEGVHATRILSFCRDRGVNPIRADSREGRPYWEFDLRKSTAILLGNEGHGITGEEWSRIPAIRIPMMADVESLNVSAAGAILMIEAHRQRMQTKAVSSKDGMIS